MTRKITLLEVFQDKKKQWRFRAKSRNGEIIVQSQAYTLRRTARRAAMRAFPDGRWS